MPRTNIIKNSDLSNIREQTLENMLDGYYVLDDNLRYIYMNKAAQRFLTVKKEVLIGKKINEFYPNIYKTKTGKAIKKALATKEVQQLEAQHSQIDKWLLNTIYPLDEGLAIQVHDITIRKTNENNLLFLAKASKLLSSSLDYKQTIKEVVKLAASTVADWCAIDLRNSKNEMELLAIEHKDVEKIKFALKLRKDYPPSESSLTNRVLLTGSSVFYPFITDEMIKKSVKNEKQLELIKQIGFNSLITVPIISLKKVIGVITFVTTETKRQYTSIDLAMAEDLANRISLAIENTKLYDEAQHAIQLRNEFISIASHELKTPVTSIKAYAQMLQRKFMNVGDKVSSDSLSKMDVQLNKLSVLINDLLDVTKIEAGKLLLHKDFYDFDELVVETIENTQHTIKQIINLAGKADKKVYGDRDRTAQVLINLLSNAAKYSPDSDKIEVFIKNGNNFVNVAVRDFGLGITKENQLKIFDRFFRATGPDGETYSGLGLGLYISHEIIRRQKGKIWVESELGKGSTFHFKLPIFKEKDL